MENKKLYNVIDIRDGLSIRLRKILKVVQETANKEGRYRNSLRVLQPIADDLKDDIDNIYSEIVDMARPENGLQLVDGHGNFSFWPAAPEFSEIRPSALLNALMRAENIDVLKPLDMPLPYLLSVGSIGYDHSKTKIPPHNIDSVIDAIAALFDNPDMSTADLLKIIRGPELYIGGEILNKAELSKIYESGIGEIRFSVSRGTKSDNVGSNAVDSYKEYCNWYGHKIIKPTGSQRGEYEIIVQYNALLTDGKEAKLFSLKEIIQEYVDYYREYSQNLRGTPIGNGSVLRDMLQRNKEQLCADDKRMIKIFGIGIDLD